MSFACGCGVERSAKCLVQVSVAQGSSSGALRLPHPDRAHSVGVGYTEAYAGAVCRGSPESACDAVLCDRFAPESRDARSCWFVTM